MTVLGVNVDHVATVRQARQTNEPDPVWAAVAAELGGADGITVHLREDRRHIQDRDVRVLRETVAVKLNLEMACEPRMTAIACELKPDQVTLVPERREEVTTEGGLDLLALGDRVTATIDQLHQAGIEVSLFLDPEPAQIEAAHGLNVAAIELHTGQYALATGDSARQEQLAMLHQAAEQVLALGCALHAGHGLNYHNVRPVAAIPHMHELNIGHSIVARALMVGMQEAVAEMKRCLGFPVSRAVTDR